MNDLSDEINQFFGYMNSLMKHIEKSRDETLHGTVLTRLNCLAVIDAMSAVRLPNIKKNGKRFRAFTSNYCGWKNSERISIVSMLADSRRNKIPMSSEMITYTHQFLDQKFHVVATAAQDPLIDDFPQQAFDQNYSAENVKDRYSHSARLWAIRNNHAHEVRGHGNAHGEDFDEPVYHQYEESIEKQYRNNTVKKYHLYHTWKFISGLAYRGIESTREYCLAERINPYDLFDYDE